MSLDPQTMVLSVVFAQPAYQDLWVKWNVGPALFQINRFATSMNSCFMNSTASFLDLVMVQLSDPVPGLNGTLFPLKSFTLEPTYSTTGPIMNGDTIVRICSPFCQNYTLFLANSPEPVIDINLMETRDFNYSAWGTISPFTALNYDITIPPLAPLGSLSCVSSNENHFLLWGLIGGAIALVIIVVVIMALIIRHKRKRHEYIPVDSY